MSNTPDIIYELARKGHFKEAQKLADIYTLEDSQDHDIVRVHSLLDAKHIRYKMEPMGEAFKITMYGDFDKTEIDRLAQSIKHVGFLCKSVDYVEGLHHLYLVHTGNQHEGLVMKKLRKIADDFLDKIKKLNDKKLVEDLESSDPYYNFLIKASPEQRAEFMEYMGSLLESEDTYRRFMNAYGVLVRHGYLYISQKEYDHEDASTRARQMMFDRDIKEKGAMKLPDIEITPSGFMTAIGVEGFESGFVISATKFLAFDPGCVEKFVDYIVDGKDEDDEIDKYALKALAKFAKKFSKNDLRVFAQDSIQHLIEKFADRHHEQLYRDIDIAYGTHILDEVLDAKYPPDSDNGYDGENDYDGWRDEPEEEKPDFEDAAPEHASDLEIPDTQYHLALKEIYALEHLAPITLRELKSKNEKLFNEVTKQKEIFAPILKNHTAPITKEILKQIEEGLKKRELKVFPGLWRGGQKSRKGSHEQLVLMIKDDAQHTKELVTNAMCIPLINTIFELNDGHPQCDDMIGWVRLEIDEDSVFVDEVQSDILGDCGDFLRKKGNYDSIIGKMELFLPYNKDTQEDQSADTLIGAAAKKILAVYKDFPHIAAVTVQQFARANGFKKIFWHTYEGGKTLKFNNPPKDMYSDLPKSHYYQVTEEQPFKLPAQFYSKQANLLLKAARKLIQ